MIIALFFFGHWFLSLFFQTFYLHRYVSHRMFTMNRFWERTFYVLTYLAQGASFLNLRAYAILHRMHHAYSDTKKDPHSPHFFKDAFQMMWRTKSLFQGFQKTIAPKDRKFGGNTPKWPAFDRVTSSLILMFLWGVLYTVVYIIFATHWWMFLLLPIHYLMGPIHGATVNWLGHNYGYRNYELRDHSRNFFPLDFLMLGELFQNNHHKKPGSLNFARRWFELDPSYPIILLMHHLGIVKIRKLSA